ncbi:uncharacterized protein [Watersipora subatra]|uniref:uncharacterized protein n=1 Tax=Watersipora subatra TaxID=2589382 RepID=UPI00355C856A
MKMADLAAEDDLLHRHSLNIEHLLKDADPSSEPTLNATADIMGGRNIWSSCSGVAASDFLCYNGYQASSHWPSYKNSYINGSPSKDIPLSSPESDAGSDTSWRCDSGVNGIDISKWGTGCTSTDGIYDPFRSSSVIDNLEGVHVPLILREKSPLRRSQSANSRPTFADVAKKPSSPGSEPPPTPSLNNDEPIYGSQESLNTLLERKARQKTFRPAHPRHGGYHVPLPISPDSKYGLDDFEAHEPTFGKMERSFSCNDAFGSSEDASPSLDGLMEEELPGSGKQFGKTSSDEKQEWFDPKRIFMNGNTRSRSESVPGGTVLNNNASVRTQQSAKGSERRGNAPYINNLHDTRTSKRTNSERAMPAMNGHSMVGKSPKPSAQSPTTGVEKTDPEAAETSAAGYYFSGSIKLGKVMMSELLAYVLMAIMFVFGLTSQTVYFVAYHTSVIVTTTFNYLAVKVGLNSGTPKDFSYNSFTKNSEIYGCDENIQLPETSEEAMRRLLTCQGKDPYSILGLRFGASNELVRKHYRRQAVLVHPDKNKQPGAEEAFKILGQAFELIGTPEKRTVYDQKIENEKWSEEMRNHTEDLLQKMREKFEEAARWIHCNKCDKRHRRYPIERPVYSARKCNGCRCYHAAKEGEIWAETTFMGFKWHFYACMQNTIYEVTDWVVCQGLDNSMRPNSHGVQVKINSPNGGNSSRADSGLGGARDMENLENLIKNLFPQQNSPFTPGKPANPANSQTDSSTNKSTPASSKKGKRRAKRR